MPTITINQTLPNDLSFHVYLFSNNTTTKSFETLVNETGDAVVENKTVASSSCIIFGHIAENKTQYNASTCNYAGTNCLSLVASSDDTRANLLANQNFSMSFAAVNGTKVQMLIEALHNISGTTQIFIYNGTVFENPLNYSFAVGSDEAHIFDLTDWLPDGLNIYNATIKPTVGASYDYAYVNITQINSITYSPKKIVVSVWGK
jgi:hypothetical protein